MSKCNSFCFSVSLENQRLARNFLNYSAILFFSFCTFAFMNIVQAENEPLTIERPWIREAPPGVPTFAAYMTIVNNTESPLTITSVSSNISTLAEIHEVKMDNEVMKMRKMTEVIIESGQSLELKPSSSHLMLMGVQQPLKHGDEVEIEFELKDHSLFKTIVPVKKEL